MDFGCQDGIGAAYLARAQAGGYVGYSLSLPILEEQQIRRGRFVLHVLQRASQRLGPWTALLSTVGSHRNPPCRIFGASRS
jgi:hypothetical protein